MKKILILISAVILLASCEKNVKRSSEVISKGELPDVTLEDVESIYSKDTKLEGKLYAKVLYQYRNEDKPYSVFPKGIKFISYDENLNENSSLVADSAYYNQKKELWEYHGNVVLVNEKDEKIETELLYADQKNEKLFTDKMVQLTFSDGSNLQGDGGFESNLNFTEWVFKDVSGQLNEAKSEEKKPEIDLDE